MHKSLTLILTLIIVVPLFSQEPKLTKLWQTEPVLKVPESVYYDSGRQLLFVSNVEGEEPWANDGKGSIAKVALDGKVINAEWVKGLNAPKGMGVNGNHLYVTDNDAVVTIDIRKGKIVNRFAVPDAGDINDLSVAEDGTIYFTDSKLGNLHKLINGKMTTLLTDIKSLNGVLHSKGELYFVADGSLFVVKNGKAAKIAEGMEGGVDGVERIDENSWLVTAWAGTVYYVTRDGKVTLLIDGRADKINSADLGYDPVKQIAYVPGFWKNFVIAYKLEFK